MKNKKHLFMVPVFALMVNTGFSQGDENTLIPGEIVSVNDVLVKAEKSGRVRKVNALVSNKVKNKETVISLNCSSIYADIAVSKAKLKKNKMELKSKKLLNSSSAIPAHEVAVAAAEVDISKAQLTASNSAALPCKSTAPFDGEIVEMLVQEGEYVQIGDPLYRIVDTNDLLVKVFPDARFWDVFSVGKPLNLKLENNSTMKGEVYKKSNYIGESRRFQVDIKINPESISYQIASGMVVNVEFQ